MKFRFFITGILVFAISLFAQPNGAEGPSSHTLEPENGSLSNLIDQPSKCVQHEGYTVNFDNISILELIQFISRISGVNFIFDSADLQFTVTIVSEDATSVEDLMAALLQILKTRNLSVVEQGNNVLIYRNQLLSKVSKIITENNLQDACESAIVTRVFRLFTIPGPTIAAIIKPLLSTDAIVEVSPETHHLVVTDITSNVNKIAELLVALDAPNAAIDIGEYHVQSAYPGALVAYAREILAPLSRGVSLEMVTQPSSQKIFIISSPFMIEKAKHILASLDQPELVDVVDLPPTEMVNNNFFMYKMKFQKGRAIADALRNIGITLMQSGLANMDFVNTTNSIQWLEVNNSLVITGTQDAIDKVVALIEDLDKAPKQVYIEVLIIDTTLSNSLDFGVQWIALGDEQNKLAFASGLLGNSPPNPSLQANARVVASPPNAPQIPNAGQNVPLPVPSNLAGFSNIAGETAAFGLGIVGNIIRHNGQSFLTLGALVSALEEESETVIVLNPRIMTEDTQPATFFVGQNIPYQTTSTVIQQTGSVTQNIQYEDIGVELKVIPTIAPDNMVTLQIDQSIQDLASAQGVLTPTVNKTLATTRVHVPDGTFLVMSGHIRDDQDVIHSGIPCLGSLPLIGPAFARNIDQRQKRNLIMFVRPHVVTNIQEGIELTNQQGYESNWENNPCSIIEFDPKRAPECESYPPVKCPAN